jgi:membrane-associated protein
MGGVFQQAVSLTGSFNLWLVLTIFLIAFIAEFGFSIPYLFETIWLLTGYHLSGGGLSPASILLFCFISLIGREIGAGALYKISGMGSTPVTRWLGQLNLIYLENSASSNPLKKYILFPVIKLIKNVVAKLSRGDNPGGMSGTLSKYLCPSPFSVALGRFSCFKIPITITLGMNRKPFKLLLGVALFSLAWDALYIVIGVFGAGNRISPTTMLISTISGFICLQIISFIIRRLRNSRRASVS